MSNTSLLARNSTHGTVRTVPYQRGDRTASRAAGPNSRETEQSAGQARSGIQLTLNRGISVKPNDPLGEPEAGFRMLPTRSGDLSVSR